MCLPVWDVQVRLMNGSNEIIRITANTLSAAMLGATKIKPGITGFVSVSLVQQEE